MKIKPIEFIATAVLLLAIDAIYLKFIGGPFYSLAVKKIQGSEEKSIPAYGSHNKSCRDNT